MTYLPCCIHEVFVRLLLYIHHVDDLSIVKLPPKQSMATQQVQLQHFPLAHHHLPQTEH